MINIGIDNGNYNTKSSDGFLYRSGFMTSSQPPVGEVDYVRSGDTFYALDAKRAPTQYDKTRNNDAWVLTLAMLAQSLRKRDLTEGAFRLGVGLPFMAYNDQCEAMRAYFMAHKTEKFIFCGKEYNVVIEDCHVYPQGYSAYVTQYRELEKYNSITHVDIGGYTVDFFRSRGGLPVTGSMQSIPNAGTVSMLRAIQSELARNDILLDEVDITSAIQGGKIEHIRAEDADLAICNARDRYVQDLCNTLREYGIDTQTPINLIGGGAELLADALKKCMYVVGMADVFANARGYALWLEQKN